MQKDDPSTKVTDPAPNGPAPVSAFHPAIPAPSRNPHQRAMDPEGQAAAVTTNSQIDATLASSRMPDLRCLIHLVTHAKARHAGSRVIRSCNALRAIQPAQRPRYRDRPPKVKDSTWSAGSTPSRQQPRQARHGGDAQGGVNDRDGDGVDDLVDHVRIGHAGHAALGPDIGLAMHTEVVSRLCNGVMLTDLQPATPDAWLTPRAWAARGNPKRVRRRRPGWPHAACARRLPRSC